MLIAFRKQRLAWQVALPTLSEREQFVVHIASPNTVPSEAVTEHISAHWLVTNDNAGSDDGFVGVLNFEAGATERLHRHSESERAMVVLAGNATVLTANGEQAAPEGTIIFAARGIWHGLRANGSRLTVLSVYGGSASSPSTLLTDYPGRMEPTGDHPYLVNMHDVEEFPQHNPARALFHMTGRKFLDREIVGSTAIILGYAGYAAKSGAHEFHRHPLADEFVYVLEGDGVHLYGDQEIPMRPGDFAHIPAGEWHGLRNSGSVPLRVLFGFLGVGGWDQRGYELPDGAPGHGN